jgi:hypothetical protein
MKFTDAQEMHRQHPDTFEVPPEAELDALSAGDHVKVCAGDERFWVLLTTVEGRALKGTVANDLLFTNQHGLRRGDPVAFEKRHVYQI